MLIFIFLIVWIASALFCASVADAKGYSYGSWFIGGFLFGFIALIAAAGLPDRKLRKYIRQIGEKQNAIKKESQKESQKEVLPVSKKDKLNKSSSNKKISFENFEFRTPIDASVDEVYKEFVKVITAIEESKKAFNSIQVDSYEFNRPLIGGVEFVLVYANGEYNFVLSSKKDNSEMIWKYSD